ncbi:hypothetical protein TPHSE_40390 (plasmid) [Terrisporobacter petrolearius]
MIIAVPIALLSLTMLIRLSLVEKSERKIEIWQ